MMRMRAVGCWSDHRSCKVPQIAASTGEEIHVIVVNMSKIKTYLRQGIYYEKYYACLLQVPELIECCCPEKRHHRCLRTRRREDVWVGAGSCIQTDQGSTSPDRGRCHASPHHQSLFEMMWWGRPLVTVMGDERRIAWMEEFSPNHDDAGASTGRLCLHHHWTAAVCDTREMLVMTIWMHLTRHVISARYWYSIHLYLIIYVLTGIVLNLFRALLVTAMSALKQEE